jgi:hypothetical protein
MFMRSKKHSQYKFKAKIFNALSDPVRLEIVEVVQEKSLSVFFLLLLIFIVFIVRTLSIIVVSPLLFSPRLH